MTVYLIVYADDFGKVCEWWGQTYKLMSESISRNETPISRRTPLHSRSYLNVSHGLHQHTSPINTYSQTNSPHLLADSMSNQSGEDHNVIYGTNVSTKEVYKSLEDFVMNF